MSQARGQVHIGDDGVLRPEGADAAELLADSAGHYQLYSDASGVLFLRPMTQTQRTGTRLLMAGEIVSKMTMLEIISLIANSNWRGALAIDDDAGFLRVLTFDGAALKTTSSSHPDDRLGEVLYREGAIERDALDRILAGDTPERRLGQQCLDENILTREQLFRMLQKQAEHTFFASLLVGSGVYRFRTIDEAEPPPAHTVHLPVQGLLMEGVQRIDEMSLFRQRIASSDLCPTAQLRSSMVELDDTTGTILRLCDGTRSVADIARESGLGEFLATKALYHLVQQGVVEVHTSTRVDPDAVVTLVGQFNDVMRDIFMAVATYGGIDSTRDTLAAWIQGSGYSAYFGDEVDEDGSIQTKQVLTALGATEAERPLEALHQALHELAAFALFSATTTLPRDQELLLARDVNRRLKLIHL